MITLSRIEQVIAEERARLERHEHDASARLAVAYRIALQTLIPLFANITDLIEERRAASKPITPGWLFAQARYRHMIEQVLTQSRTLAQITGTLALEVSDEAARLGAQHALEQLGLAIPDGSAPLVVSSFAGINQASLATIVAELGPESPLVEILAQFPSDAAAALRTGLVRGMALGLGADEISRSMRRALNGNLVRANTIIRTEIHRAHREATRAAFQANSGHLNGWIWMSALSSRTCAACWAMHGTKHPLNEPMGSHPNCRCTMAPWTKSFRELGLNVPDELETRVDVPTGQEIFATLPPRQQRAILGPSGYELYRTRKVALSDFVKVTRSEKWGVTRSERSIESIAQSKGISLPVTRSLTPGSGSGRGAGGAHGGSAQPVAPVSAALSVPADPRFDQLRTMLTGVDSVHMDGTLPSIRVTNLPHPQYPTAIGWFDRADIISVLDPTSSHAWLTFAHEVGHAIDWHVFGSANQHGSHNSPKFREWDRAVRASAAYQAFEAYVNDLTNSWDWRVQIASYTLRPSEVWARSYSQWVIRKSQIPEANADLDDAIAQSGYYSNSQPTGIKSEQWDDADFGDIAQAIEDLFKSEGWMPSP